MKDYMAVFNINENENEIRSLTTNRPIASIPFASRYRVIDFMLSNVVNAGITNVGIFYDNNTRSLIDHIDTGKPWDLNRKNDGVFMFNHSLDDLGKMDPKVITNNLEYFYRSKSDMVILTSSYMICNIDIGAVCMAHEESGADITMLYKHVDDATENFKYCYTLNINKNTNEVIDAGRNIGLMHDADICMEVFIMSRQLFVQFLHQAASSKGQTGIYNLIFDEMDNYKTNAYEVRDYVACINSISAYYKASMDMLSSKIRLALLMHPDRPIYTKIKDEHPTLYVEGCQLYNSLIADGCIIKGNVRDSIIARYVTIEENCELENCIILQNCKIKAGSKLSNVIIDKNAVIDCDTELKGSREYPVVIEKRNLALDLKF